ncbi:hypothetical protein [Bosea sp. (in: a-proteobacteria)]
MREQVDIPISSIARALRAPETAQVAFLLVLLCAGVAVTWVWMQHLDEVIALYGFSPTALIDPSWLHPEFASDFPNGEAEMLKSLAGQIYYRLGALGVPRNIFVSGMVFIEFCTLALGAFLCARAAAPERPAWTAVVAALLLTTGSLVSCDLARWFHPYYGSAYNFAYGFGFAAMAAILRHKPIWAGLCLGVTAAFHPIIALFFGLAIAVAALLDLSKFGLARLVAGGAVVLVITAAWTITMFGDAGVSGETVDPQLFVALSRLMSSHWFPITIGVFWDRAFETSIPFTGFMVLLVTLLRPFTPTTGQLDRRIGAAILLLLAVTAVGFVASEYSGVPLLVKLALHRASSGVLLLGAIVVVPCLAFDVVSGSFFRAALAAALLLMAFWHNNGPPVLLCIAYAIVVVLEERASRPRAELWMSGTAILAALAIVAMFAGTSAMPELFGHLNLGVSALRHPLFLLAAALAAAAWFLRAPVALAAALAVGALAWAPQAAPIRDPAELEQAASFRQVQEWAQANTPVDSLFMLDPTLLYGWREVSKRPSFGTLREWLYSGWTYNTRADVFRKGLERARWLGLDMKRYLNTPDRTATYFRMTDEARRLYNSMDELRLAKAAAQFGISFFVFDRQSATKLPTLSIAFQNERYIVLAAP